MKKLVYLCFLMILFSQYAKAQTSVYTDIVLFINPANYTVTATYDTTYSREVIITLSDTIGIQSLQAELSVDTENGWQTQQTVALSKSNLSLTPCFSSLCLYRKNGNQWVLYLGAFPLSTRHKIELHFTSLFTNATNLDWDQEF